MKWGLLVLVAACSRAPRDQPLDDAHFPDAPPDSAGGFVGGADWTRAFVERGEAPQRTYSIRDSHKTAVAADGSVIIAGRFERNLELGGTHTFGGGDWDAYVAKLTATGVAWTRVWSAPGDQIVHAVLVAPNGHVFVAGSAAGTIDFGLGANSGNAIEDAVVVEYDANGAAQWVGRWGDAAEDQAVRAIALGPGGELYLTGAFDGDMSIAGGANLHCVSQGDGWAAKLAANRTHVWSVRWGITSDVFGFSTGTAIHVDGQNTYVTGYSSARFNFAGAMVTTGGDFQGTLLQIGPNGEEVKGTKFGGPGMFFIHETARAADGDLYISGLYRRDTVLGSTTIPGFDTWDSHYLARIAPSGAVRWATRIGGRDCEAFSLAALDNNRVLVGAKANGVQVDWGPPFGTHPAYHNPALLIYDVAGKLVGYQQFGESAYEEAKIEDIATHAGGFVTIGTFEKQLDLGAGYVWVQPAPSGNFFVAGFPPR